MSLPVVILMAESAIIRKGLMQILNEFREFEYKEADHPLRIDQLENAVNASLIVVSENLFHPELPLNQFLSDHHDLFPKLLILRFPGSTEALNFPVTTIYLGDSEQEVLSVCRKIVRKNFHDATPGENAEVSKREREIIRAVALGMTSKEISDMLFISPHTVITHRKNINRKLGIKTVSGLTVYAILNNIITTDELE